MAKLMMRYYIENEDKDVCTKANITIETYLKSSFMSDICEIDQAFADSIQIVDFRVEKAERYPEENHPDNLEEWHIWLVNQDEETCKKVIKSLREVFPAENDWTCVS